MKGKTAAFIVLVLLVTPLAFAFNASTASFNIEKYHHGSAGETGDTATYSFRSTTTYEQGSGSLETSDLIGNSGWFDMAPVPPTPRPPGPGGGGGGGGGAASITIPKIKDEYNISKSCFANADCAENQYCFNYKCYDAECSSDDECAPDQSCWNLRCVKLFDVKILEFESPVKLGEFFDFTYLMKGMADINGDVIVEFWLEKDGSIASSGSDTIYLGSFEEKIEKSKIFLPGDVSSGGYSFIVKVTYGKYSAQAHRTVEILVKDGVAELTLLPEEEDDDSRSPIVFFMAGLIGLAVFVFLLTFYIARKKIAFKIKQGENWVIAHQAPVLLTSLFCILGILSYYFKLFKISTVPSYGSAAAINVSPYVSFNPFFLYFISAIVLMVLVILLVKFVKHVQNNKRKVKKPSFFVRMRLKKYKVNEKKKQVFWKEVKKNARLIVLVFLSIFSILLMASVVYLTDFKLKSLFNWIVENNSVLLCILAIVTIAVNVFIYIRRRRRKR
jgi:hypothetical protein